MGDIERADLVVVGAGGWLVSLRNRFKLSNDSFLSPDLVLQGYTG